ncbi:MAG: hypothetical protein Q8N54_01130 [Sulfurimicrobium sp.]|nr:hypothetical protein [Sulfurimicrobium sp.]MDO9191082.1 hypothetical protein [Sulfurimicrobium sp.]MDP1704800.1 hypothetical protein [Sulfurimicrobium sp.]MDP2198062.1 hypothetical protein [Sulfurimicrobium sp.]MDP2961328.1 hypothetical protein [Sulfurimicrobium sp.]
MEKAFQIFKSGRHTTMAGVPLDFSDEDLKMTAASYPPKGRIAPLTLGHPKNDLPVMGRVKSLFFKNGGLYAYADVYDSLVNLVREGRYKNLSAKFSPPTHPNNPVPGVYSLIHVGFLGASAPAVRGMEQPSFSDHMEGNACFSMECELGNCDTFGGFNAPAGLTADPAGMRIYELAKTYQRAAPSLTFFEAARMATNQLTQR